MPASEVDHVLDAATENPAAASEGVLGVKLVVPHPPSRDQMTPPLMVEVMVGSGRFTFTSPRLGP
jgi:hypothetical protein